MRCVDLSRKAGLPAEELREMAGIRVAHLKGNGRYALLRFAEQSPADAVADEFLTFATRYLGDNEFRARLQRQLLDLVTENEEIQIHARKLSDILKVELPRLGLAHRPDIEKSEHVEYYRFRPVTGAMYMVCLANRMASDRGLPLISDHPVYQRLIRGVQDGTIEYESNPDKGYLLASAVIESVIPENLDSITVDQIISFRTRYNDERHRFYNAVSALAKDIPKIRDPESFRDCLNHHEKTIQLAVKDLRLSLGGIAIACTTGFLGLSIPAWASAVGTTFPNLAVPVAAGGMLTMACGLLGREGLNYYKAKQNSPYSYILSIKRELRRKFFGELTHGLYLF